MIVPLERKKEQWLMAKGLEHLPSRGRDFAAKIRLSNGDLIAGDAPNRVLREARHWLERNRVELLRLWNEFQRGTK
jgi:hypothetical protein